MPGTTAAGHREQMIAVVGGGASGTLTAIQLLRQAAVRRLPLQVVLIDRDGRHGLGQAYSTWCRAHLLNAMAGQMSALPDDPGHLVGWADRSVAAPVTPASFLPRQDYGRYLRDTLAQAEREAAPHGLLTRLTAEVRAIRRVPRPDGPFRLFLPESDLEADAVVFATGNAAGRLPFAAPDSDRIVANPWRPGALAELTRLAQPASSRPDTVVVVGTGLTMVDLAIAIAERQPATRIHAVSRHGLLPRAHPGLAAAPPRPLWLPALTGSAGPVGLADLMWQIRLALEPNRANWPEVMSSLRPLVPGLWGRLSVADQRLFLRHVARYWEVHRHLMPPATASRIIALRGTGRLVVHSGQIRSVTREAGELRVMLHEAGGAAAELRAGWLINATGTGDITATASPLLRDLFATGQARPDAHRLGIDASADGAVLAADGVASQVLFALGPMLRGLRYETTAIAEIRDQAAALAQRITSQSRLSHRPGSAV